MVKMVFGAGKILMILSLIMQLGCERTQSSPAPPPAVEVGVIVLKRQSVTLTTELPGRTSPFKVAEIRPQVNGLIQKRFFTEGSNVKAGQLLYKIDPAPYQAALDNALAALARAEANVPAIRSRAERLRALVEQKAVSQQEYDDASSALRQAEAEVRYWKAAVESARINLGYTNITAPISGIIGRSSVTEGAIVTAYQPLPLATIQQLDPIYVDVPQSTTDLLKLREKLEKGGLKANSKENNEVGLVLEDGSHYPLKGTLQFRDVTVDPTTGSVILRIIFPNPDHVLLPGMFVRAIVKEGTKEDAILVPQQAVTRDPKGNPIAFIVNSQNTVEPRSLSIDRAMGDKWLVTSGLEPEEKVIVEGLIKVRPGVQVRAVPVEEQEKQQKRGS